MWICFSRFLGWILEGEFWEVNFLRVNFSGGLFFRRAKSDGPKVTEPNLRFPALFCENLRFSAKICGFLRFPAPSKCWNFQEKGWICKNLRFSAKICVLGTLCHLRSVTLSSAWSSAGKKKDQKIRPKNSGPKFGRLKFVSQNSAPNSGFGGAKSPVQEFSWQSGESIHVKRSDP